MTLYNQALPAGVYYVPPPKTSPNIFASFLSNFLQTRNEWAMDVFRARLAQMDPTQRANALLRAREADLAEQREWRMAQKDILGAATDIFRSQVNKYVAEKQYMQGINREMGALEREKVRGNFSISKAQMEGINDLTIAAMQTESDQAVADKQLTGVRLTADSTLEKVRLEVQKDYDLANKLDPEASKIGVQASTGAIEKFREVAKGAPVQVLEDYFRQTVRSLEEQVDRGELTASESRYITDQLRGQLRQYATVRAIPENDPDLERLNDVLGRLDPSTEVTVGHHHDGTISYTTGTGGGGGGGGGTVPEGARGLMYRTGDLQFQDVGPGPEAPDLEALLSGLVPPRPGGDTTMRAMEEVMRGGGLGGFFDPLPTDTSYFDPQRARQAAAAMRGEPLAGPEVVAPSMNRGAMVEKGKASLGRKGYDSPATRDRVLALRRQRERLTLGQPQTRALPAQRAEDELSLYEQQLEEAQAAMRGPYKQGLMQLPSTGKLPGILGALPDEGYLSDLVR